MRAGVWRRAGSWDRIRCLEFARPWFAEFLQWPIDVGFH